MLILTEFDVISALALITKASPAPIANEQGTPLNYLQLQTFAVHQRVLDTSFFSPNNLNIDIKKYQYKDFFYSRHWDGDQNGKIAFDYPILSYHKQNEEFNAAKNTSLLNFQLVCSDTYSRKIINNTIPYEKFARTREEVLDQLRLFLIGVIVELRTFCLTEYYKNSAPTITIKKWLPPALTQSVNFLAEYTVIKPYSPALGSFIANLESLEMGEFQDASSEELLHYVANLQIRLSDCASPMPSGSYDAAFFAEPFQTETT